MSETFLVTAFICLCVFCRWCHAPLPAFRRCKVTTRFPFLQEVSDLAPPRFRPGVRQGCCNVCVCARRRIAVYAGHPLSEGLERGKPGLFCFLTGEILLPSWTAIFSQLGSSTALSDALSVHSVPRPQELNWGVEPVFYLPINCSFILTSSLHRAREIN